MRTEAQEYEAALAELITEVETKIAHLDKKGVLSASDEIELAALEVLLDRLDKLESY